jgi:hypothetical protein
MHKITEGNIIGECESTIPYTLLQNEKRSDTLCVMLPGLGYATQRPLFHYATGLFLENGIDVFLVNYTYKQNQAFLALDNEAQARWMKNDIDSVIDSILPQHAYSQFILLSKSIDSIPMAHLVTSNALMKEAPLVWLTPLLPRTDVKEAMLSHSGPSLSVISKKDHFFRADVWSELEQNPRMETVLFEEGDHSLELANRVLETMHLHQEVMKAIERFIKR